MKKIQAFVIVRREYDGGLVVFVRRRHSRNEKITAMDEEGGPRLSKRFSYKTADGEVDYKTKSRTAWSHSYLNQNPWHPLSYPNQRLKWIVEQTHAQRERRSEEVAREYAQEQEFFRHAALVSKKEKEKK